MDPPEFERVYRLTTTDGLTGLRNQRFFIEHLHDELVRCHRRGQPLAMILFDVDGLRRINDRHGFLAGDFVLKEIGRRASMCVADDRRLARVSGEELAAILPETDRADAVQLAERILRLVADEPVRFEDEPIAVTLSAGIAMRPTDVRPTDVVDVQAILVATHGGDVPGAAGNRGRPSGVGGGCGSSSASRWRS
jgi:two-component system, cell cycle response regulator